MVFIIFQKTRHFDTHILPYIDKQAIEWSCSRSDAIRAILYAHYKQPLPQKSQEKINEIYAKEAVMEKDVGDCLAILIDPKLKDSLDMRAKYYYTDYQEAALDLLCRRLGTFMEPVEAIHSQYSNGVSLGPGKGRVIAVITKEGREQYANRKKANT